MPLATNDHADVAFAAERGRADHGCRPIECVTGDVAFTQSVLETGWFRFGGVVPALANNFAGIGATDGNPAPAVFPDARTGIRAQIQHLRAYADASALTLPERETMRALHILRAPRDLVKQ